MRRSIPEWCILKSQSTDRVREVVRGTPALAALGVKIGPVRAYSEDEFDQILRALEVKRAARRGEVAPC
jgi:hypothetical protein